MKRTEVEPPKEAKIITLAKMGGSPSTVRDGMKFCNGYCQDYLPVEKFDDRSMCRCCCSQIKKQQYQDKKQAREMFI